MFVAAVWMFFDSGPYEAWLDVVVTGLFVIAIAVPALLWLTWRRNADDARDDSHLSFRDWAVGDFDTLTGVSVLAVAIFKNDNFSRKGGL
jgi:hypothetical protein